MDIYIENVWIGERFDNSSEKLFQENIPNLGGKVKAPAILLIPGDSLSVAEAISAHSNDTPLVLNFANNDRAGGGYSLKGTTQEEVLLKRTTLGGTLPSTYYPIDTIVDKYQYWDYQKLALIYSPEVHIIRNDCYEITDKFCKVAMITCAAINNPRTAGSEYMFARDRDVTRNKIRMILDVAALRGHKNLIAGQWGCGAFGNPLEICKLWIDECSRRDIKVIFPLFDNAFGDTMRELLNAGPTDN